MNAVIQVPICPLMLHPVRQGELADEVLYGMTVKILEDPAGGFCKVKTLYGYTGYAPEECLLPGDAASHWSTLPKQTVLYKNFCDILAEPTVQSCPLLTLPRGALVHFVRLERDGWQRIRLCDGREGYTKSSFFGEYYEKPPFAHEQRLRHKLEDTALLYMGTQYRWGGKTPLGIDCSGLTFMAYFLNGIVIWRDAQIKEGYPIRRINLRNIARGDLLFFPGHVAMYLENGLYIHSTAAPGSDGVVINSLDPAAPNYRADLAGSLSAAGSIF